MYNFIDLLAEFQTYPVPLKPNQAFELLKEIELIKLR